MDSRASLADELKDLEKLRGEFKQNDSDLAEKEKRDRKLVTVVNWTKVRKVYRCDECTAPRCFFSRYVSVNDKGPKKNHFDAVQRHVDANGYTCEDVVQALKNGDMATARTSGAGEEEEPLLFYREAHVCGTSVKAQYYAPEGDTERGGVITKNVCCH